MNRWKRGPEEAQLVIPRLIHSRTIYFNGSPLLIYVGVTAFHQIKDDDELDQLVESVDAISQVIVDSIN